MTETMNTTQHLSTEKKRFESRKRRSGVLKHMITVQHMIPDPVSLLPRLMQMQQLLYLTHSSNPCLQSQCPAIALPWQPDGYCPPPHQRCHAPSPAPI